MICILRFYQILVIRQNGIKYHSSLGEGGVGWRLIKMHIIIVDMHRVYFKFKVKFEEE